MLTDSFFQAHTIKKYAVINRGVTWTEKLGCLTRGHWDRLVPIQLAADRKPPHNDYQNNTCSEKEQNSCYSMFPHIGNPSAETL